MQTVNDFSKQQIMECYGMMINFVSEVERSASELFQLKKDISLRRIGIPKGIYDKIMSFVEGSLEPIADNEEFEDWCHDCSVCGQFTTEGDFVHITLEEKQNFEERYAVLLFERLRMVEAFAMKELYPALTGDSAIAIGTDNSIYNAVKWSRRGIQEHNKMEVQSV